MTVHKEQQALKEQQDHKGLKVIQGLKVLQVEQVLKVRKVTLGRLEHKVIKDLRVLKVLLEM